MKILRIIYDWPPPWSGLAPHPYEISMSQVKLGHTIDIFCGRWPYAGKIIEPTGTKLYTIFREPFPGTLTVTSSIILFFQYLIYRKKNKVDIIHSHGHFGIWIYLYRFLLKKLLPWSKELKTPLVVHFHNTAKGRWVKLKESNKITNPLSELFVYPMEVIANKLALKVSAANIFVSKENLEEAKKYYKVNEENCFVVESGINYNLFKPVGDEEKGKSRKDLGLDMYDRVVLYHGVLVRRKNPHLLVQALRFLPDNYKLVLSGPISDAYMLEIDEIVKRFKLDDKILKTGYVPYPEAPIAYQIADIFVLPSEWEGMPKVVLESLACGIPALVSGFKFPEEVSGIFYLSDKDPENIAKNIADIVDNPPPVDFTKFKNVFSWDNRVQEIEKIYEFAKKHYL